MSVRGDDERMPLLGTQPYEGFVVEPSRAHSYSHRPAKRFPSRQDSTRSLDRRRYRPPPVSVDLSVDYSDGFYMMDELDSDEFPDADSPFIEPHKLTAQPSWSKELKRTMAFSGPVVFTQICQMGMQPIATAFGGRLSEKELDAIALANMMISVLGTSIITGMVTACHMEFSQAYGSDNKSVIGIMLQKSLYVLLLTLLPMYAIQLNIESILLFLGQEPVIANLAGKYVMAFMPGMLFLYLYIILRVYTQCQNVVWPHLIIGMLGLMCHALLQYICLYVLKWGVVGSAIAQASAYFFLFAATLFFIIAFRMYADTWEGWDRRSLLRWGDFLKNAVFGAMMTCLVTWAFAATTVIAGVLGTTELGAQSVIYNLETLLYSVSSGMAAAVSIRVGHALGAGNVNKAKLSGRVGVSIITCLAFIYAVLYLTLADYLPRLFTNVESVVEAASRLLPFCSFYTFFDQVASVQRGVIRGLGRQPMGTIIIFISYYCLTFPIGIPLMFKTDLALKGLWLGLAVGMAVGGISYFIYINAVVDWSAAADEAQLRVSLRIQRSQSITDDIVLLPQSVNSRIVVSRLLYICACVVCLLAGILVRLLFVPRTDVIINNTTTVFPSSSTSLISPNIV